MEPHKLLLYVCPYQRSFPRDSRMRQLKGELKYMTISTSAPETSQQFCGCTLLRELGECLMFPYLKTACICVPRTVICVDNTETLQLENEFRSPSDRCDWLIYGCIKRFWIHCFNGSRYFVLCKEAVKECAENCPFQNSDGLNDSVSNPRDNIVLFILLGAHFINGLWMHTRW